uniref:Uncharacterized protein n=1 Tax=Zooxanthella nutricula TaxID=1333877 RepID=A0A6V0BYT1_9DINO|mmetsp:Transcript_12727/g.37910  ORF Transcript_12727/g.37910 Transcript_12727/m.37910 type:complete len:305 (+) Transcript_12727:30-944(+)
MDVKDISVKEWEEMEKWERVDVSALALKAATSFVTQRPVTVGVWVFGLLLAAFAGGLPVTEEAQEAYCLMLQRAEVVDSRELGRSAAELQTLEEQYYGVRGWFGACDDQCSKLHDKVQMARAEVDRVRQRRDEALSQARHEVSIWSAFGVQDVRRSFWAAWKSGQDFASRVTMYDALFLMMGREETFVTIVVKLVLQYVVNLTIGLVGSFFYFMYNVYFLIMSYGAPLLSGLGFFLLTVVAGMSVLSAYLGCLYGAVAGGGMMLMQHAVRQAALMQAEERQRRQLADGDASSKSSLRRGPRCPV